jgi:transposase InsO family protein
VEGCITLDQRTQFIADFLRDALSLSELCALYRVALDRLQVDRPLSAPRAGGLGGALAAAAPLAKSDVRRDRERDPGRPAPASDLGRQKAAGAVAQAPAAMAAAGPFDGVQHSEAAWDGADQTVPTPYRPSRQADERDPRAQRCLECGLQRPVPHRRRAVLLYPLTVADGFSRYLLGCQALASTASEGAKTIFRRLFQEYGLPKRIRSDNGVPFATNTLARLSTLSAWWVRLGILPELIEPGRPAQNGRHERMHRTLKAETTRPAAGSLAAQQRKFNVFREEFNHERPHEALDQETPASCYTPSPRPMPDRLPPLEYPDRFEVRYVSANGGIRWNSRWVNVSVVCVGEYVGLEEIDDGLWNVYFGPLKLGRLHERRMRIEDAYGRLYRHRHV